MSADGSVVVGAAEDTTGNWQAYRWTAATGKHWLGTLGGLSSEAFGVSADGSIVVGRSTDANNNRLAFRWTAAGGMKAIGTLGGLDSEAFDVSGDGSVVVGDSSTAGGLGRAFRWTAATGMQNLSTLYAGNGASYLSTANAVSSDGAHVVGYGYNSGARTYQAFETN